MALNESQMADLVIANIAALGVSQASPQQKVLWDAICKGIIDHIKASGATTTVVTSGSSAGTYQGTIS